MARVVSTLDVKGFLQIKKKEIHVPVINPSAIVLNCLFTEIYPRGAVNEGKDAQHSISIQGKRISTYK